MSVSRATGQPLVTNGGGQLGWPAMPSARQDSYFWFVPWRSIWRLAGAVELLLRHYRWVRQQELFPDNSLSWRELQRSVDSPSGVVDS